MLLSHVVRWQLARCCVSSRSQKTDLASCVTRSPPFESMKIRQEAARSSSVWYQGPPRTPPSSPTPYFEISFPLSACRTSSGRHSQRLAIRVLAIGSLSNYTRVCLEYLECLQKCWEAVRAHVNERSKLWVGADSSMQLLSKSKKSYIHLTPSS